MASSTSFVKLSEKNIQLLNALRVQAGLEQRVDAWSDVAWPAGIAFAGDIEGAVFSLGSFEPFATLEEEDLAGEVQCDHPVGRLGIEGGGTCSVYVDLTPSPSGDPLVYLIDWADGAGHLAEGPRPLQWGIPLSSVLASLRVSDSCRWSTERARLSSLPEGERRTVPIGFEFPLRLVLDHGAPFGADELARVRYLALGHGCTRDDLSALASMPDLEYLALDNIPLENLAFLSSVPRLEALLIQSCQLADISDVKLASKLRQFHAPDNRIIDYAPLVGLPAIEAVTLSANPIDDAADLLGSFVDKPLDRRAKNPSPEEVVLMRKLAEAGAPGLFTYGGERYLYANATTSDGRPFRTIFTVADSALAALDFTKDLRDQIDLWPKLQGNVDWLAKFKEQAGAKRRSAVAP